MTGKEFYSFIKKSENKNRYFITFDNRVCHDEDIITMECSKEKYWEWRVQKNHEVYLDKFKRERECISINSYIHDSETMTYEEVITDDSVDVEDDLMRIAKNKLMKDFFETLQPEEKVLIKHLYIENDGLNETKALRNELDILNKSAMDNGTNEEFDRIITMFRDIDASFEEFDDIAIRRLVECIRVMKDRRIVVVLKGGLSAEESF